jgi:hypothetical protein
MDTIAALSAPRVVVLDAETLPEFLKNRAVRVVQAHATDRPFGLVLKGLVHGRMGTHARCGRLDLRSLDGDSPAVRRLFRDWVDLAGIQGLFPPPEGYYLFHDRKLMGFHPAPESDEDSWVAAADIGLKGLRAWASERDLTRAGRHALDGRAELDILRFFEAARAADRPSRAPGAPDRRNAEDRRGTDRDGPLRRGRERLQVEFARACRLLGVDPEAGLDEVKKARNALARRYHPDRLQRTPELAEEGRRMLVRINAAYSAVQRARQEVRTA